MQDLTYLLLLYLPLGLLGLWRWGTWLIRRIIGFLYQPVAGEYQASVSVVTPVYNEDPRVFRLALES